MSETWIDNTKQNLNFSHFMNHQHILSPATRESKMGRARGGLLVYYAKEYKVEKLYVTEDFIFLIVNINSKKVIIGSVYANPNSNFENFLSNLDNLIYECSLRFPNSPMIIGGDFNAKIGNLNQLGENFLLQSTNLYNNRSSLFEEINKRGKLLVEYFEKNGFIVVNGRTKKDNPAQTTYLSRIGSSIIDFVWVNSMGTQILEDLEILEVPTGSDHFPLAVTLIDGHYFGVEKKKKIFITNGMKIKLKNIRKTSLTQ